MRVGFIGLGRMGQGMARRILSAGHDLTVFDQVIEQAAPLGEAGATVCHSLAELVAGREVVIDMLPTDAALESLALAPGGLVDALCADTIHMAMGTHGVDLILALSKAHGDAGQAFVATPVLGRPDLAAAGQLSLVPAGPKDALERCAPLFAALGRQSFVAGSEPQAAAAAKVAHNFVLGCAIEAMGEAFALVRKLGVEPELFHRVLTEGLFGAPAYEIYGKIIVDESYDTVGASALIGLKDANLALAAGDAAKVPLPSANVWRDRLLGAIAHGDADRDWAVMALEQARASGIETS